MKNFFKNPFVIAWFVVAGFALIGLGLSAILKLNNERNLQRALDDINSRINQATSSRSANLQELISERDALIEIIKNTI